MSSVSRMSRSRALSAPCPPAMRPCALTMSVGLLHAGRHVGAHVIDRGAGLVGDELVGLEIDAEAFRLGRVTARPSRRDSPARCRPRRDLAEVAGAVEAAGAVHVLHDDVRLALDVLGDVPREQPALDVGRAAGREVDQHGQPLALVEGIVGARDRGCAENGNAAQAPRRSKRDIGHLPKFCQP